MNNLEKNNNLNKHHDEGSNLITLTIVTVDGTFTNKFNIHQLLQHIVDMTINKLDLTINLSDYDLVNGSGTMPLQLSSTIEQAGIENNSILQFRKRNAGGGA